MIGGPQDTHDRNFNNNEAWRNPLTYCKVTKLQKNPIEIGSVFHIWALLSPWKSIWIWSDFDRASSLICGNKTPTRCNRWIYCRFYCMLNMFWAIPCPSSGAREYYTDGRCLWYLVLWYDVELKAMCPVCSLQTGHTTFSSTSYRQPENQSTKYHRQRPSV